MSRLQPFRTLCFTAQSAGVDVSSGVATPESVLVMVTTAGDRALRLVVTRTPASPSAAPSTVSVFESKLAVADVRLVLPGEALDFDASFCVADGSVIITPLWRDGEGSSFMTAMLFKALVLNSLVASGSSASACLVETALLASSGVVRFRGASPLSGLLHAYAPVAVDASCCFVRLLPCDDSITCTAAAMRGNGTAADVVTFSSPATSATSGAGCTSVVTTITLSDPSSDTARKPRVTCCAVVLCGEAGNPALRLPQAAFTATFGVDASIKLPVLLLVWLC